MKFTVSPKFFSDQDKAMFLEHGNRLFSIDRLGEEVTIIAPDDPDENTLRTILGFFARFHLDMSGFAAYLTDENRHWFFKRDAYWFAKVFLKSRVAT